LEEENKAMNPRQAKLLFSIINQYIKNATPVASKLLAGRGGFKLSSATLRNEMADLEKEGYLIQPHTSAGRIPTEKGYEFYLDALARQDMKLTVREEKKMSAALEEKESPEKMLAKVLAELTGEAVILAFGPRDVYYTGLSNLFAKPEFREHNLIYRLSEVVDHLDEMINEIFERAEEEVKVLIGKKNPFSDACGALVSKYRGKNKKTGLVAVLGPMRMDYARNISLIKHAKKLLEKI